MLRDDGATLADCQIVLTLPASFDEIARTLTHESARVQARKWQRSGLDGSQRKRPDPAAR